MKISRIVLLTVLVDSCFLAPNSLLPPCLFTLSFNLLNVFTAFIVYMCASVLTRCPKCEFTLKTFLISLSGQYKNCSFDQFFVTSYIWQMLLNASWIINLNQCKICTYVQHAIQYVAYDRTTSCSAKQLQVAGYTCTYLATSHFFICCGSGNIVCNVKKYFCINNTYYYFANLYLMALFQVNLVSRSPQFSFITFPSKWHVLLTVRVSPNQRCQIWLAGQGLCLQALTVV